MNFFTTDRITESTTQIRDITGVFSYLVEGNQKACLIDCGTGTGDIKQIVESLTNLFSSYPRTLRSCGRRGIF